MFFLYYNKKTRIPTLFLLPEFSFICLYLLFSMCYRFYYDRSKADLDSLCEVSPRLARRHALPSVFNKNGLIVFAKLGI